MCAHFDNSGCRIPATGNKSLHLNLSFLVVHSGLSPYITLTSLFCPADRVQIEKDGGKEGRKKGGKQRCSVAKACADKEIVLIKSRHCSWSVRSICKILPLFLDLPMKLLSTGWKRKEAFFPNPCKTALQDGQCQQRDCKHLAFLIMGALTDYMRGSAWKWMGWGTGLNWETGTQLFMNFKMTAG